MKQLQISSLFTLGCGFNIQSALSNSPAVVHTSSTPPQIKSIMSPLRDVCTWQLSYQGQGHQLGLSNHPLLGTQPSGQTTPQSALFQATAAVEPVSQASPSLFSFLNVQCSVMPCLNPYIAGIYQILLQNQWV